MTAPDRLMTRTSSTCPATVAEFYRLVDSGDLDSMLALFTEDARYNRPGYAPLIGQAAIEHFYRYDRVISSGQHVLDTLVVNDEQAAVSGSFEGRSRDGKAIRHRFAEFFQFSADGRFCSRETFFAVPHV